MRKLLAVLILAFPISAWSSELSFLIEKALTHNKRIKEARSELKISEILYKEAISDFLPKVNLFYSRSNLSDVPSYYFSLPGAPPSRFSLFNRSYYRFGVTASQPIFTGGRILFNAKLKEEEKEAAYYLFKETVNKVVYTVKADYYELLKAKANVTAAENYLKAARKHYNDVKAFFDQGIVPRRDLLEAEVKLKDAQEKLIQAKSMYTVALEKLKTDVGDVNLSFFPKEKLSFRPVKVSLKELIKQAYENRPLVLYYERLKEGSSIGVKFAASDFLPSLLLNVGYEKTDQYPGEEYSSFSVSFNFNFPLFSGGKRFLQVERALLERTKAEVSLKEVKEKVRLQVVSAYTELLSAASRVKTAKAMVEKAKELLRDSKERYREHVGTSTEVADAMAYLYGAERALSSAVSDYYLALSKLEYATGKELR